MQQINKKTNPKNKVDFDLYETINSTTLQDDEYINPYNEKNKLITLEDIKRIFSKFDIEIDPIRIELYIEALTHKSYIKKEYYDLHKNDSKPSNALPLFDNSYERLEFVGDTVIKSIVASYLFVRYQDQDEGFMTALKASIEDRDSLAIFGKKFTLGEYAIISKQTEQKDGRNSKKLLEDCFEAFIGALFLDVGFEVCRRAIWILLETEIDYSELLYKDKNYKGQLNNFYTQNNWPTPKYKSMAMETINGIKMFIEGVEDFNGNVIAQGKAKSKKEAQKIASMLALKQFGVINEDQMIKHPSDE
jgi:ribonuclease-3